MDLVDWLRARLDDDEQVARAATPGPWRVNAITRIVTDAEVANPEVVAGSRWGCEGDVFRTDADAVHIARHDPARVLAEVAAKRRILNELLPQLRANDECVTSQWDADSDTAGDLLRLLALPYADHPDYDPDWAVT